MTRKRKGKIRIKHLILMVSIALLNVIGVSYAYYTSSLIINTSISTGNLSYEILSDFYIDGEIAIQAKTEGEKIIISGETMAKKEVNFSIYIKNTGTMPIIVGEKKILILPEDIGEIPITIVPSILGTSVIEVKQWNSN